MNQIATGWIVMVATVSVASAQTEPQPQQPYPQPVYPQQQQQAYPQQQPVYPQQQPVYPQQPGYPPPAYGYPPPQAPQYMQLQPPLVRYVKKPLYPLLFSGVGIFGLGYIMDVFGTLVTSHQPAWECALPVVGPMLQVRDRFDTDFDDLARAFYVFDAILQTAGFVLTVVGASVWRKVPVRVAQNGLALRF
jgi:hypothetical protein